MSYDESFKRTVNGVEFEVFVTEDSRSRKIQVHDFEQRENECHSYLVIRETRKSYKPGKIARLMGKSERKIPDRGKHVREVFNKAMARYFNREEDLANIEKEIEQNLDASVEAWNE